LTEPITCNYLDKKLPFLERQEWFYFYLNLKCYVIGFPKKCASGEFMSGGVNTAAKL
jgi:hypothetical protein